MDIKTFLKTFIQHFFLIYACTIIATLFFLVAQGVETLSRDYLWQCILFSLAADAPLAVFITKKGEEVTHYTLRTFIHAVLLEAFLMPIGYAIDMWSGVGGAFVFFFTVIAVDLLMHLLNYLGSSRLSSEINKVIIARRSAEKADPHSDGSDIKGDNTNDDNADIRAEEE